MAVDGGPPASAAATLQHRRLPSGTTVGFGPEHIHEHRPALALSIHVHAPRLRTMTFYDPDPTGGLRARPTEDSRPDAPLA